MNAKKGGEGKEEKERDEYRRCIGIRKTARSGRVKRSILNEGIGRKKQEKGKKEENKDEGKGKGKMSTENVNKEGNRKKEQVGERGQRVRKGKRKDKER